MKFSDARAFCPRCGKFSVGLPDTQKGATTEQLGQVYNLFDSYIQYSISEGFGMPVVEAAACGVPVMCVDYSAMEDTVRRLKGTPLKVQRVFREPETHYYRVYPDNDYLVEQMAKFTQLPEPVRLRRGREAKNAANKYYTWDRTAKVWEDHFNSLDLTNKWGTPPRIHTPSQEIPNNLPNPEALVQWGLANILGEPERGDTYMALRMVRDLNYGATTGGTGGMYFNEDSQLGLQQRYRPFTPEDAMHHLAKLCERKNYYEQLRVNWDQAEKPTFIRFAKPDEREMR
jgi:hypothetical protein